MFLFNREWWQWRTSKTQCNTVLFTRKWICNHYDTTVSVYPTGQYNDRSPEHNNRHAQHNDRSTEHNNRHAQHNDRSTEHNNSHAQHNDRSPEHNNCHAQHNDRSPEHNVCNYPDYTDFNQTYDSFDTHDSETCYE